MYKSLYGELSRHLDYVGLEYGRYGVSKVLDTVYWGFLGAQIRCIFLVGYGVLVVRTVIFKYLRLSSRMRPLADIILNRDIYVTGYRRSAKVNELIDSGSWRWSLEWYSKYPNLINIVVPNLSSSRDRLLWLNTNNLEAGFSVAMVWNCIRPRYNEVDWYHVVWFSHQIPRHAIHLWLVIKRKLKTHDNLRQWDVREHLKGFSGLTNIPFDLNSIVDFLILRGIIGFSRRRPSDQLIEVIMSTVRLKLLSCKFKKTKNVQMLIHLWKFPSSLIGSSY
ncbi:hypothetical protein Tco_1209653 [Tanacetum coccineum]